MNVNRSDENIIIQVRALGAARARLVLMEMRPREGGQKEGCFYLPEFKVSGLRKSGGEAEISQGAVSALFFVNLE